MLKSFTPNSSSFPSKKASLRREIASEGDVVELKSRKIANSIITLPDFIDTMKIRLSEIASVEARLDKKARRCSDPS